MVKILYLYHYFVFRKLERNWEKENNFSQWHFSFLYTLLEKPSLLSLSDNLMIHVFTCTSVLRLWTAIFNIEENWYSCFLCNLTYHSSLFVSAKIKTCLGDPKCKKINCLVMFALFSYDCFETESKQFSQTTIVTRPSQVSQNCLSTLKSSELVAGWRNRCKTFESIVHQWPVIPFINDSFTNTPFRQSSQWFILPMTPIQPITPFTNDSCHQRPHPGNYPNDSFSQWPPFSQWPHSSMTHLPMTPFNQWPHSSMTHLPMTPFNQWPSFISDTIYQSPQWQSFLSVCHFYQK